MVPPSFQIPSKLTFKGGWGGTHGMHGRGRVTSRADAVLEGVTQPLGYDSENLIRLWFELQLQLQ